MKTERYNIGMDFSKKTVPELKAICKEIGIKNYTGKRKDDIIQLLEEYSHDAYDDDDDEDEKKEEVVQNTVEDTYTTDLLKEQYALHKSYVQQRINTTKKIGVKVRLSSIPEDITENIVKQIIHNKLNDKTSSWGCKTGDLLSQKEGKQEVKCFTSNGPLSFTPSSHWDVLYFLDARNWLNNIFILYTVPLKITSNEWKHIKISKMQTFEDQTKQGRRPRISWNALHPQIESYCNKVYEGTFEDIFIPLE